MLDYYAQELGLQEVKNINIILGENNLPSDILAHIKGKGKYNIIFTEFYPSYIY